MADQEAIPDGFLQTQLIGSSNTSPPPKKKRNLPGNPDPEAEVIGLSPKTLMATNRFLCEICGKGFQRDQNLQLHRRGHNLPWKLKQRTGKEPRKRVYICPEKTCVHNHPSRALGDLTGIKKHFCRKHGEKKWKCEKCNKKYAVHSDWKAHSKTCGTKEYTCDCGTIFSRRDSFITHRAFCDALAEETARMTAASSTHFNLNTNHNYNFMGSASHGPTSSMAQHFPSIFKPLSSSSPNIAKEETLIHPHPIPPLWYEDTLNSNYTPLMIPGSNPRTALIPALYSTQLLQTPSSHIMSATALLQKAAQIGSTSTTSTTTTTTTTNNSNSNNDPLFLGNFGVFEGNNDDFHVQNGSTISSTKYSGFGTSNSTTTNVGSDEGGSPADDLSTLAMYNPPTKRQKLIGDHQDQDQDQTLDFLGVGSNPINCHLSSMNRWI